MQNASYSQDTSGLRKEISVLLKKYGVANAGFELKVNSTNQKGGQTAFVINNNYNYTVVNDIPMYAKYDLAGVEPVGNVNMISTKPTGLPFYMRHILDETGNRVLITDSALTYCDTVIEKYPNFPYGHYCMAVILQHKNDSRWIQYAKQAVKIFEITTKLELHEPDHDVVLADLKRVLKAYNIQ